MKTKILLVCVIIECVYVECKNGITSYQDEVNMISQDDRRGATNTEIKSEPDLHTSSSTHLGNNAYLPPSHDSSEYSHSVSYPSYYYQQPPTYYTHGGNQGYDYYEHTVSDHRGEHHHQPTHTSGNSKGSIFSALALKGILIPLAGIALLGAAAALSTNPVLLQLGVLNGRRKRSLSADNAYPINPNLKAMKKQDKLKR